MKNIKEVSACPKCESNDLLLQYVAEYDWIHVKCGECAYETDCKCADAAAIGAPEAR